MDTLQVEVVYEHRKLKLPHALPLQEGEKVTITIHPNGGVDRMFGMVPWMGDPDELRRYLEDSDEGPWGRP